MRIAPLQFDHVISREIGKGLFVVKAFSRRLVEGFQIGEFGMLIAFLLVQIGDKHAELRAPIAHVIVADNIVPRKFERPRDRVTDNCATQMTYVHLLRQVWMRIVDDDLLGLKGHRPAQALVGKHPPHSFGQPLALQRDIDKTRAGNLHRLSHIRDIQLGEDFGRQFARVAL